MTASTSTFSSANDPQISHVADIEDLSQAMQRLRLLCETRSPVNMLEAVFAFSHPQQGNLILDFTSHLPELVQGNHSKQFSRVQHVCKVLFSISSYNS